MEQKEFNRIFANHVGVCHWTKSALQGQGMCYKQAFYGIRSHQCLELAPVPDVCNLDCKFCWRNLDRPETNPEAVSLIEVPGYIDHLVALRNQKISGFGNQEGLDLAVRAESLDPKFWTISYSGEPALSPDLPGLVSGLMGRSFKTLVVTNGTRPEALEALGSRPPTQLYVSLCGFDESSFAQISQPREEGLWQKVVLSLEGLKRIQCRRALRITLIQGFNTQAADSFAKLVALSGAQYVEFKAYAHMGQSINRLPYSASPKLEQVRAVARQVADLTGYLFGAEQERGAAVLLCRDKESENKRLLA